MSIKSIKLIIEYDDGRRMRVEPEPAVAKRLARSSKQYYGLIIQDRSTSVLENDDLRAMELAAILGDLP